MEKHTLHSDILHAFCRLITGESSKSHVILLRAFFPRFVPVTIGCKFSYFSVLINLRRYLELWLLSLRLFSSLFHGMHWKKHLVMLVSNCSPFPLPWLTFQFHTGLSTRLPKSQEEAKSININYAIQKYRKKILMILTNLVPRAFFPSQGKGPGNEVGF